MIQEPILLIHGFSGWPENWTGPKDRFPEFLAEHGFDPELIRVFSYGDKEYKGKPVYNNTGDIREIAHRLDEAESPDPELQACAVDRLSRDSVTRGGPARITIIAHSSGGLLARYYLTRKEEDEFHTRYRGNVGRVIFLGTPHHGVDIEDLLDPLPTNALLYRLLVRVHFLFPPDYDQQLKTVRDQLRDLHQTARRELLGDETTRPGEEMPAFNQMNPGSAFLHEINRPGAMPEEISYFNILGDVRTAVRLQVGWRRLVNAERSMGDFLVSTQSAGDIPNARACAHAIRQEYCLEVDLGRRVSRWIEAEKEGAEAVPIHRHLRSHPESRAEILRILRSR